MSIMEFHGWSADILFATDARGPTSFDCGGFAVVVSNLAKEEVHDLLRLGEVPGYSVAR